MKTKSKPKRRQKKTTRSARASIPVSPAGRSFPVVAMAASAGGLEALSVILGGLPVDFPAAITIVMHVAPGHKSLLAEILTRATKMQVTQVRQGMFVEPNRVYIIPPNTQMKLSKGAFRLTPKGLEYFGVKKIEADGSKTLPGLPSASNVEPEAQGREAGPGGGP